MKKRLYVPHPGRFDGLKELISAAGKGIYAIFMAGSPDYVDTDRNNPSSPMIEDIRKQTLDAHKNGVVVEIVMSSSCLGGRQLTPAEKHAAQDEYSQITKQMRRRQCRADAIGRLGEDVQKKYYQRDEVGTSLKLYCKEKGDQGDGRFVRKGIYPKFTSDISPNRKDIRTRVRMLCYTQYYAVLLLLKSYLNM